MPLVRVRIVLGKSVLGEPTRPFAPGVSVKAVVDQAFESHQGFEIDAAVDVFKDVEENDEDSAAPYRIPRRYHRR